MDSFFDSIIPLLLILFYLFSGLFRKQKEGEPSPEEPSYPQPEDEPPSLREEIRRRFQERTQQLEEASEPHAAPIPFDEPVSEPVLEPKKALLAQRERLDELRRKVVDIKRDPKLIVPTFPSKTKNTPYSSSLARLRQRLRDPKTVAEAIVLMEILGTPVGLRKPHEQLRPH